MSDSLLAFVFVQTEFRDRRTATLLARIPEVEELHRIAGDDCYVLRVRVPNTEQLGQLIRDKIEQLTAVHSTRTTLVLRTLKDKQVRTLDRNAPGDAGTARWRKHRSTQF
jgi:Lrp/AsnC family leucine-responsive transcriptional regulator